MELIFCLVYLYQFTDVIYHLQHKHTCMLQKEYEYDEEKATAVLFWVTERMNDEVHWLIPLVNAVVPKWRTVMEVFESITRGIKGQLANWK